MLSKIRYLALLCGALIVLFVPAASHAQQNADIVLRNGKILTVDADFSVAQAGAVISTYKELKARPSSQQGSTGMDTGG